MFLACCRMVRRTMMKKILWLALSCMMVLSLVIAACGRGSPETPAQSAAPVPQTVAPAGPQEQAQVVEEKVQTPAVLDQKGGAIPIVALATDAPKYGGTLWLSTSSDTIPRSDTTLHTVGSIFIDGTNEELLGGDWTLGPAGGWGSNVANWASNPDRWDYRTGVLAERPLIWKSRRGPSFTRFAKACTGRLIRRAKPASWSTGESSLPMTQFSI